LFNCRPLTPRPGFDVEELSVVDDRAGEHAVEVLIVDAMRTFDLAI